MLACRLTLVGVLISNGELNDLNVITFNYCSLLIWRILQNIHIDGMCCEFWLARAMDKIKVENWLSLERWTYFFKDYLGIVGVSWVFCIVQKWINAYQENYSYCRPTVSTNCSALWSCGISFIWLLLLACYCVNIFSLNEQYYYYFLSTSKKTELGVLWLNGPFL